ncbi:MAG: FecR domain-containing protein [bacterium]
MMLKRIAFLIVLISSAIIILCGVCNSAIAASLPVGRVEAIIGSVRIKHKSIDKITRAQKGSKIYLNDHIKTDRGAKVKIRFIDRSSIYLVENSYLVVKKIIIGSNGFKNNSLLRLLRGNMRAEVEKLSNRNCKFEIETRTAVVGAVGADFIIATDKRRGTDQKITNVICCEGSVSVQNRNPDIGGEIILHELEHTSVLKSKKLSYKWKKIKNKINKKNLIKLTNKLIVPIKYQFISLKKAISSRKTKLLQYIEKKSFLNKSSC